MCVCVAGHFPIILLLNRFSKYLAEVGFRCFSVTKLNVILWRLICQ